MKNDWFSHSAKCFSRKAIFCDQHQTHISVCLLMTMNYSFVELAESVTNTAHVSCRCFLRQINIWIGRWMALYLSRVNYRSLVINYTVTFIPAYALKRIYFASHIFYVTYDAFKIKLMTLVLLVLCLEVKSFQKAFSNTFISKTPLKDSLCITTYMKCNSSLLCSPY